MGVPVLGSPDGFTGIFVESRNVLHVKAIKREKEHPIVDDRGRAGTAKVVAFQVTTFPNFATGFGVEAGRAVSTEMNVNPALFNGGSRRTIAVCGMGELRLINFKQLQILQDLAGIQVDTEGGQGEWLIELWFLGGRILHLGCIGHPDLFSPDDWGGPGPTRNRGLPDNFR